MIRLNVKGDVLIQGDGEPDDEAKKLEDALNAFLRKYRAESGEIAAKGIYVEGSDTD